jgi:5-methyltetrahydropteroyltriglutamate--homocysteine methyltransferase
MRHSTDRILTTHVGSLPKVMEIDDNAADYDAELKKAVDAVVAKQREVGLDIVNEGEYTKGGDWLNFVETRFGGYEEVEPPKVPLLMQGKDREEFADYYNYMTERGVLFYAPSGQIGAKRRIWACTGPVTYTGGEELAREIDFLKASAGTEDIFLTSTAPASLEVYFQNKYYDDPDDYLYALADALAVEYKTVTDAGVVLQIDDAWLPALWDRIGIEMGMEAFRERCRSRVEALNHAIKGIPEEMIRYHFCWGSWKGPHAFDLELKDLVDIMLEVKAQAYVIEGANVRHEHEYAVWDDVKLPDGKILIPGMVTHSTDNIEHPELVAQRIRRFVDRVGKESVIAGADCGFGGRSHPQIAWAKLKALAEGAALVK